MQAEELAMYWLALSALGLIVLFAQTGIGQVSISQISQAIVRHYLGDARRIMTNALAAVAVAGGITAGLVALLFAFGTDSSSHQLSSATFLFLLISGVLCPTAMQVVDCLRAQQRHNASAWLAAQPGSGGAIPSLVMLVSLFIVSSIPSLAEKPQPVVYASFLLGWLLMLLLGAAMLSQRVELTPRARDFSITDMRRLVRDSWPVVGGALAMFIMTQADLWFVGFFRGPEETAAYGLAATLVKYASAVNVLLGALLPGMVGQLWAEGRRLQLAATVVIAARAAAATVMS